MKKIRKLFALCAFCFFSSIAINMPTKSVSKIWAGIAYAGNVNRNQGLVISAADGVCQVCLYYGLLGTGATGGASLVLGLGLSA